ncbi:MAG: polyphosphate kinase 2 [Gemmatimonadetes bacterium]|jgi:polyphosphate kinase|nr:polyphosphate kinase 2 [Gemmatimonadota bacterium]
MQPDEKSSLPDAPVPVSETVDSETQDDVLLDREAIAVDTDESSRARADAVGPTAGADGPLKPHGRDAESLAQKQAGKGKKKNGKKSRPVDLDGRKKAGNLKTAAYLDLIMPLHVELLKFQNWVKEEGLRIAALFEGRDAAGKGGTIKRFVEHMNPRGCRVIALAKPTEQERNQWYFQRYTEHLPTAGEVVLFDRSWYNRAMVERAMGFCTGEEVKEFLRSAPEYERMLIRADVKLFKFYFSVSKAEQARRFRSRLQDPLKQWKLSDVDREGQDKWDEYTQAKEDMFFYTSTADAPWTIIKSDDKKRARLNAIRFFLSQFDYTDRIDEILQVDNRIVRQVADELHVED